MITCSSVKRLLNEALLDGKSSISIPSITKNEEDDLIECGYIVKKKDGKVIISH
jgi:hypothetical protein